MRVDACDRVCGYALCLHVHGQSVAIAWSWPHFRTIKEQVKHSAWCSFRSGHDLPHHPTGTQPSAPTGTKLAQAWNISLRRFVLSSCVTVARHDPCISNGSSILAQKCACASGRSTLRCGEDRAREAAPRSTHCGGARLSKPFPAHGLLEVKLVRVVA